MSRNENTDLDSTWSRHHAQWRDPAQITAQWHDATELDTNLLAFRVHGAWWESLAAAGVTLLVTREYEHLVMAISSGRAGPEQSYLRIPHPSGLTVDSRRQTVYIASTRNPNCVVELAPAGDLLTRGDVSLEPIRGRPLVPVRSWYLPGCLYLHDLAIIGGKLYGNAVGQNAVIRMDNEGQFERVWWPRCIESSRGPIFDRNHLQLNSIAAGRTVQSSYFSASTDRVTKRRPGHKNFAVDRRGVIFSGSTREPIVRGLTRPHSVRLHHNQLWIDNSGYGEFGVVSDRQFVPVTQLPGWTRGLCLVGDTAFVGTSRVIPRFRHYAPGLDVDRSLCGIHAIDLKTGRILGSLLWPAGNQIFAIDFVPAGWRTGFPGTARRTRKLDRQLFYAFTIDNMTQNGARR